MNSFSFHEFGFIGGRFSFASSAERSWRTEENDLRRNLSVIEKGIAWGQAHGEILPGDPRLFAVVSPGVTLQIIRQWIREKGSGRLVDSAGFAADCFLHGSRLGSPPHPTISMKTFAINFLAILALASCGRPSPQKPVAAAPAPVEVASVETRDMPVEMKAIGAVEPIASVQLKSKVQGEILEVHFADGARVNAGDLLFSIDPRPFQAALKRAEANLSIARFAAANAIEQADRYSALIKSGVASKEQTSQILSTADSQRSGLAARQADVDEAQLSIEWSQVRAPISGRAGAALLKAGNIAQPNVDTLAVINQMQPISVAFSLPENSLADIREWMKKGTPSVSAHEPDSGRVLGTGELDFIDNTVDRASGMITFKATFPNTDESLWPGQFVDVTVKLAVEPNVIVIPSIAIMEGQQGAQVFVVRNDTATLRKVEVARTVNGVAIIRNGLQAGELVITTGQLRVTSGSKVAVKDQQKPAASPEEKK